MLIKNIFVIFLIFLAVTGIFYCKKKNSSQISWNPEITANLENDKINIKIQIPRDHHAYLDSGKDNNLIPIQFDWNEFLQKKILPKEPNLIVSPEGEWDTEVQATVLRNTGMYEFQIDKNLNKDKLKEAYLKIKIQICNEISGICYRPQIYEVKIQ